MEQRITRIEKELEAIQEVFKRLCSDMREFATSLIITNTKVKKLEIGIVDIADSIECESITPSLQEYLDKLKSDQVKIMDGKLVKNGNL